MIYIKDATDTVQYQFVLDDDIKGNIEGLDDDIRVRHELSERLYSHGAANIGDGKIQAKYKTIEGHIQAPSFAELLAELKTMLYFCELTSRPDNDWRLYLSQFATEYYRINALSFFRHTLDADGRGAEIEIEFLLTDPFRYEAGSGYPRSDERTGLTGAGSFVIPYTSTGTNTQPIAPLVTITPTAGTLDSFLLQNKADDDIFLVFNRYLLNSSAHYLEIDMNAGTVMLGYGANPVSVDMIRYLDVGRFYQLRPGNNQIYYRLDGGATAIIKHVWRRRWL